MALAPDPGTYIVGDVDTDGHTHTLIIGEPEDSSEFLRNDFPRATSSEFFKDKNFLHAHSISALQSQDKTMICNHAFLPGGSHNHTKFTKVEE